MALGTVFIPCRSVSGVHAESSEKLTASQLHESARLPNVPECQQGRLKICSGGWELRSDDKLLSHILGSSQGGPECQTRAEPVSGQGFASPSSPFHLTQRCPISVFLPASC